MRKHWVVIAVAALSTLALACSGQPDTKGNPITNARVQSATPSAGTHLAPGAPDPARTAEHIIISPTPAKPATPSVPTINEGTWTVGEDFPAGTYKTTGSGPDCYWQISPAGSNGSQITDNHLGGGNLRVTLKAGQEFTTERCGVWTKVG